MCVLRRYSQQLCLLEHMQNEITSLRGVSQLAQEKLFVLNREFASLRRQHAVVQQDFAAYRTPPGRPPPPLPPRSRRRARLLRWGGGRGRGGSD